METALIKCIRYLVILAKDRGDIDELSLATIMTTCLWSCGDVEGFASETTLRSQDDIWQTINNNNFKVYV